MMMMADSARPASPDSLQMGIGVGMGMAVEVASIRRPLKKLITS